MIHSSPDPENTDPAAGVSIMLSARMTDKVIDQGHVGSRIEWVRIAVPVCNIFFITVYVPHKGSKNEADDSRYDYTTTQAPAHSAKIRIYAVTSTASYRGMYKGAQDNGA